MPIIGSIISPIDGMMEPDDPFRHRILFMMPTAPMTANPVWTATGDDLDRIGRKYGQVRMGLEAKQTAPVADLLERMKVFQAFRGEPQNLILSKDERTPPMTLPAGYLPKAGDELLIRARVKHDVEIDENDVHVEPVGHEYRNLIIPLVQVHSLACRKWNPKDRVMWIACDETVWRGVVVSTWGDQVWLRKDVTPGSSDEMQTRAANDLQPEPTEPEADAAYRDRIISHIDRHGLIYPESVAKIKIAIGADLDRLGEEFSQKRIMP